MVRPVTENTLKSRYRDDFDAEKGYHRILFNNSRPLQARELTQMQTIIQEELKILGKNIFKEGAAVSPGGYFVNSFYNFIKLDDSALNISDLTRLVGRTFQGSLSGVNIKVLETVAADTLASEPSTIYVQYTNTLNATSGANAITVQAGEQLTELEGNITLTVQSVNTPTNPAFGRGTTFQVGLAEFFTTGFFVRAAKQKIFLEKYSSSYTGNIGFRTTQEIWTTDDDVSLYDNQGLLPNTTAPGADRLKINLELIKETDIAEGDTFIYYARLENSQVVDVVTGYDNYNIINDFVAMRTAEESGNYTVEPFYVNFLESQDNPTTNLTLRVSTGKAYVDGYRIEKNRPTFIDVPKSLDTKVFNNEAIGADYGYYVIADSIHGVPNININEKLIISSQASAFTTNETTTVSSDVTFPISGNAIADGTSNFYHVGECKVRAIDKTPEGKYRIYIFDLQMYTEDTSFGINRITAGQKFSLKDHARSIGIPVASSGGRVCYAQLQTIGGKVFVKEAENQSLLFKLSKSKAKDISNVSASRIVNKYSGTITSAVVGGVTTQVVTITTGSSNAHFADTGNWIVTRSDAPTGVIVTSAQSKLVLPTSAYSVTVDSGLTTATIAIVDQAYSFGQVGQSIDILAYATKTLTVASKTVSYYANTLQFDDTLGYLPLPYGDIIEILDVRYGSANGEDASGVFILDNGQRETHYQNGRLVKKDARTLPTNNIYISFSYYSHSKSGDYFSVNSYGVDAYTQNPTYIDKTGNELSLLSYLDFRPTMSEGGNFTDADGAVRAMMQDADVITADIEYYLPRADRLVLNEAGNLVYIQGTSQLSPILPEIPLNTMSLYEIRLAANSLSPTDVKFKRVENKRYTMRDIGKIEQRIDKLERATALSLLELDTKNIDILDADGRNRTKTGFFADNFANQFYTNFANVEYRASIDPSGKVAKPAYRSKNIGLNYSPDLSTNTVLVGDNVYLDYTEERAIYHSQASRTENVNPFLYLNYPGTITLSPASDEWKETEYSAANVIDGGTVLDTNIINLNHEWAWQWYGNNKDNLDVGASITATEVTGSRNFTDVTQIGNTINTTTGTQQTLTTSTYTVSGVDVIREEIGDRVIDVALIPFMRSRLVSFKVDGMQPNSRIFPYFDGISVDRWCRAETFTRIANNKIETGNLYRNATEHPFGGSTPLYTDAKGSCEGSFFIPSTPTLKFRTGIVEFKFLDVSVNNDANAVSVARTTFASKGLLYTRQKDILSTRHIDLSIATTTTTQNINVSTTSVELYQSRDHDAPGAGDGDPLAQSFFVGARDGMFVTKVSLYFASKDPVVPVWIQLRPMVNGYPSSSAIVPGSHKLLNPDQVTISSDASIPTNFVFDEPIYLNSNTEYCIVVITASENYEVWTSKMGDFELGTTEKRISRQAFTGSLFKSQSSFTWEASQFEDMKFDVWKANFGTNTSGEAVLVNNTPPRRFLELDPVELWYDSNDDTVIRIHHANHGHNVGDDVIISGLDSATEFGEYLNGTHEILAVDHTGYVIARPSGISTSNKPSPVSSVYIGGTTTMATENLGYNIVWPSIDTLVPSNTSVKAFGQFMSGKSYAGTETPYTQDASKQHSLKLAENNYFDYPRTIKNELIEYTTDANRSAVITVEMNTSNPDVSPMIDMQRCSLTLIENVIDNPAESPTSGENASIVFTPETHPTGGTAASKHITNPISLLNTATGIRVIFGANRPSTCGIHLYYKTGTGATNLAETEWVYIEPDAKVPADDDINIFREYNYTIGGIDGNIDEFDIFQLKLVFTSYNSSKIPAIRDLRAIALGD